MILENRDLFGPLTYYYSFPLLHTKFRYNTIRDVWCYNYGKEETVSFELIFEHIMCDEQISDNFKELILFNMVELKNLKTNGYYRFIAGL